MTNLAGSLPILVSRAAVHDMEVVDELDIAGPELHADVPARIVREFDHPLGGATE